MLRIVIAGAIALAAFPAAASEGCLSCYRPVDVPARYGTVVEKRIVRAPRTYALYTPAEYRTVYESVVIGGGRRWTVSRDQWGRKVGCWVDVPARHEVVPRQVMVRAAEVVPFVQPTAYGYASRPTLVEPARRAWAPIAADDLD